MLPAVGVLTVAYAQQRQAKPTSALPSTVAHCELKATTIHDSQTSYAHCAPKVTTIMDSQTPSAHCAPEVTTIQDSQLPSAHNSAFLDPILSNKLKEYRIPLGSNQPGPGSYTLRNKGSMVHAHKLQPIPNLGGTLPYEYLKGSEDAQVLICALDKWGINNGDEAMLFVCQTADDIKRLYDSYKNGYAINIEWYLGPVPVFIYREENPQYGYLSFAPLKQLAEEDVKTFVRIARNLDSEQKDTAWTRPTNI